MVVAAVVAVPVVGGDAPVQTVDVVQFFAACKKMERSLLLF